MNINTNEQGLAFLAGVVDTLDGLSMTVGQEWGSGQLATIKVDGADCIIKAEVGLRSGSYYSVGRRGPVPPTQLVLTGVDTERSTWRGCWGNKARTFQIDPRKRTLNADSIRKALVAMREAALAATEARRERAVQQTASDQARDLARGTLATYGVAFNGDTRYTTQVGEHGTLEVLGGGDVKIELRVSDVGLALEMLRQLRVIQ